MVKKTPREKPAAKAQDSRENRLKAALKANMARRKAQMRARREAAKPGDASENEG